MGQRRWYRRPVLFFVIAGLFPAGVIGANWAGVEVPNLVSQVVTLILIATATAYLAYGQDVQQESMVTKQQAIADSTLDSKRAVITRHKEQLVASMNSEVAQQILIEAQAGLRLFGHTDNTRVRHNYLENLSAALRQLLDVCRVIEGYSLWVPHEWRAVTRHVGDLYALCDQVVDIPDWRERFALPQRESFEELFDSASSNEPFRVGAALPDSVTQRMPFTVLRRLYEHDRDDLRVKALLDWELLRQRYSFIPVFRMWAKDWLVRRRSYAPLYLNEKGMPCLWFDRGATPVRFGSDDSEKFLHADRGLRLRIDEIAARLHVEGEVPHQVNVVTLRVGSRKVDDRVIDDVVVLDGTHRILAIARKGHEPLAVRIVEFQIRLRHGATRDGELLPDLVHHRS